MSHVNILKDGEMLIVPVDQLYLDVGKGDMEYRPKHLIHRYKNLLGQGISTVETREVHLRHLVYQLRLPFQEVRTSTKGDKFIRTRSEEATISRAMHILGGYRFKTREGVLMEYTKEIKNGRQRDVTILIRNSLTRRVLDLPNIYPRGTVCWGVVGQPRVETEEDLWEYLNKYLTSSFNNDLNRRKKFNPQSYLKLVQLLRMREDKDRGTVPEEVTLARQLYRTKLHEHTLLDAYILLELSTLFDLDYVVLDSYTERY